ncbi:hypothetical protein ACS0TY_031753 [Phlomoides rotata]
MSLTARNRSETPKIFTSNPLRRSPPLRFRRGDIVEVSSFQEGFLGSYYEGTVVADLLNNDNYVVQYRTLVTDDYSAPLRELASVAEVRPRPPPVVAADYKIHDVVDVFANEGWWVGRITSRVGDNYSVFFDSTGEEIDYAKDLLRIHQDWINGKWYVR